MKCFMVFTIYFLLLKKIRSDDVQQFKDDLEEFLKGEILSQNSKDFSAYNHIETSLLEFYTNENISSKVPCDFCDGLVNSVITLKKIHTPDIILKNLVSKVCTTLKFEDKRVCDGLTGPVMDVILYIIGNGKNVTGSKFCTLLLGPTCHNQYEFFNWTITVPPKPVKIPDKIIADNQTIRILHLTDMHIDPRYTSGKEAVCGEILCCQDDQDTANNTQDACGIWGDYRNADTPMKLLEETLRHAETQNFDYVYSTGDIISHRIWSTSRESNTQLEKKIMKLMRETLKVPILFVMGNHEPHPINMYPPMNVNQSNLSIEWLYEILKEEEEEELLHHGDFETIKRGGFYTVLLRPGFRVVVLNNNVCYLDNYWLAYEDYDPYGQLVWLIDVLLQAEKDGEYIHILYHVPTGSNSCLGTWAREYNRIISRFNDTISGQFNGHTHADEFFLYYNETNSSEVIQIAFNGASLTTFVENNPSYKIYDVNTRNYRVEDFEEWTFNLTEANMNPEKSDVNWFKLYSFKETYGLSSLGPEEVGQMVNDMAKNKTRLEIYNRIKFRMGAGADRLCDDACHTANLCRIVTSETADTFHCEKIKNMYYDNVKSK